MSIHTERRQELLLEVDNLMDKTTVSAQLTLVGDYFDIGYVTGVLDISPTYTRNKDELLRSGTKAKHTAWGVGTDDEISLDIENQLGKILSLVQSKTGVLSQLCSDCNAEWRIEFVVRIENGDTPSMFLSKEFINFAAAIDAQVDFDVYILSARE